MTLAQTIAMKKPITDYQKQLILRVEVPYGMHPDTVIDILRPMLERQLTGSATMWERHHIKGGWELQCYDIYFSKDLSIRQKLRHVLRKWRAAITGNRHGGISLKIYIKADMRLSFMNYTLD